MAFQLQVSNSLEQLAAKLCADIQSTEQDVFQPVYIVTQTAGMNNWLKLQMADRIGIAANCRFLKPNDLINKIYYLLGGTYTQALSAENLTWLLFQLLGEDAFVNKYPAISAYYINEDADRDVKRMALAEKLSDLYDQYQVYRPDMIQRWNDGAPGKTADDAWQQELWVNAKEIAGVNFPDKTYIGKEIEDALQDPVNTEKLQQKMPVIYLFGISLITEYHLRIFQQLADYTDIHFLLLNPAPAIYWMDDKSEKHLAYLKKIGMMDMKATNTGNPLLTGWGKIIQDTLAMLFKNEDLINIYDNLQAVEPPADNLLHKIQHAIFENEPVDTGDKFTQCEIEDGTIVVNSCYSPAREVEVLYNYLVHLVDKKQAKLSPRDIVVMVSDINLYGSYIKAVFDNGTYSFKYTIADESYAASDSISNALHAILSVTEDNFTAEEVTRLLDSSYIRNRFQLTNPAMIRNVVDEANIRFGMDGSKEDDSIYISWNYGLKRMMYGICISGGEEFGTGENSFYPLDGVEGAAAGEVIRFVHFADRLMDSIKERVQPKTIEGWVNYVDNILHQFICKREETTDEDYLQLLGELENYNAFSELFTGEVSYEVFIHHFLTTLTGASSKNSFAAGGITFCSLIPMRSIPFKVVALLGLNFDKFPRKENSPGFNLMEEEKRKGDRNIKENDKHLFLETLLSAKDYLYISYIGQSVKDNSAIPPSTLVDELVDFIATSAQDPEKVRELLVTKQPLHGFSRQYNAGNSRLYSYAGAAKPAIGNLQKAQVSMAVSFDEVPLDVLVSFLKNPFKGYYNKVLGIYYNEEETLLRETELFELDHLQQWALKNQLLTIEDETRLPSFKDKLIKTGGLPLKNMAEVAVKNIAPEVSRVKAMLQQLTGNSEEEILPVDIQLGSYHVTGAVKGVYGDKLVVISWSKHENKYLLEAYIRYLALRAAGADITLHFISCNKDSVFDAAVIPKPEAALKLEELLDIYAKGHEKIIAFDPDFKIEPGKIDKLDERGFEKMLKDKFDNYNVPCNNAYMVKEYEDGFFKGEHIIHEYKAAAEKLLVSLDKLFTGYFK